MHRRAPPPWRIIRLFLIRMPQQRRPKGTRQGGQYAPSARAADPGGVDLHLPSDNLSDPTPDETINPRPDIPVVLARYGNEWKFEPLLSVTSFGVLAAMTSTDIPRLAEQLHSKAVNVVGWGAILTNMLNSGDMNAADASALLSHVADYDREVTNRGKRSIMENDKCALDTLPDDLQNAKPFLAIAYLETKGRILLDNALTNTNPGELMLRELLDVTPGPTRPIAHTLEEASGMCFRSDPRTQWTDFTTRLKRLDSAYRLERNRNHKRCIQSGNVHEQLGSAAEQLQRPYAAPNQHLWEKCEIGTRFGKPNSFAQLYERYQKVGLQRDAFLDEIQITRALIDKANDLQGDTDRLSNWWQAQKQHLAYYPRDLDRTVFCDIYALHGGNPPPERANVAAALHVIWNGCDNHQTRRYLAELVLLPRLFPPKDIESSAKTIQRRWANLKTLLSDYPHTVEDLRSHAHECAPGMSFP